MSSPKENIVSIVKSIVDYQKEIIHKNASVERDDIIEKFKSRGARNINEGLMDIINTFISIEGRTSGDRISSLSINTTFYLLTLHDDVQFEKNCNDTAFHFDIDCKFYLILVLCYKLMIVSDIIYDIKVFNTYDKTEEVVETYKQLISRLRTPEFNFDDKTNLEKHFRIETIKSMTLRRLRRLVIPPLDLGTKLDSAHDDFVTKVNPAGQGGQKKMVAHHQKYQKEIPWITLLNNI